VLDRKAQAWSAQVLEKAHAYMTSWADQRGISRSDIEVGMLVERLILLLQTLERLRTAVGDAERRVRDVENRVVAKVTDTGSADSAELESASLEAQEGALAARQTFAKIRSEIDDVRARLRGMSSYGAELASHDDQADLAEWSQYLLGSSAEQLKCRQLLELQEEWALRVGRSSDFHAAMLASAQVVAGTCIGMAGVRGMAEVVYDLCIVDEASKATVTEILVPMARSRKWILVGDPRQLPPFFEDETVTKLDEFDEEEVRQTLLDRFLGTLPDHSRTALTNQFRMVKPIGDLVSDVFYGGKLTSPKVTADVVLTGVCPKPVTWLSTSRAFDVHEVGSGQSFRNEAECRVIRDLVGRLDFIARKRKAVYEIVVIAGYIAQVKALQDVLRDRLHEWSGLKITCSTVDAFQGSEAEICIYSVTRSNREGRLGFLRERPRLNVALSRGRSALIVVGDDEFCRVAVGENPFRNVLDFIDAHPDSCDRRSAL
jgi:AAA domain